MKFGKILTGHNSYERVLYDSFLENSVRGSSFHSYFKVLSERFLNSLANWHYFAKPSIALRDVTLRLFEKQYGEEFAKQKVSEYMEKLYGSIYYGRGSQEISTEKLRDLYMLLKKGIDEGLYKADELYDYLNGRNPKLIKEISSNPNHPKYIYEIFRKTADELGKAAVGLGLMDLSSYRYLSGRYFPHILLEGLSNNADDFVLLFAMREGKLIYDRWRRRVSKYFDEEDLMKAPHITFTWGMAQEIFDIHTARIGKFILETEKAFNYPNVSKDAIIKLPDGREVPIRIALIISEANDYIIENYSKIKEEIIKDIRNSPEYLSLPREERKKFVNAQISEIESEIRRLKSDNEKIKQGIDRYKYILTLLERLLSGKITGEEFVKLSAEPDISVLGRKPKEGVDYSYLSFDAEYYLSRLNDWVLIPYEKLGMAFTQKRLGTIPNVEDYHLFAGLLVTRPMYGQIAEYYEFASPMVGLEWLSGIHRLSSMLTSTHKIMNVAINPASWVKNVIGNFIFYYLAGVPVTEIPKYYFKGLKFLTANEELLKTYGISAGGFSTEILNSMLDSLRRDVEEIMKKSETGLGKYFFVAKNFLLNLYERINDIGVGKVYDTIDKVARAGLLLYFNDINEFGREMFKYDPMTMKIVSYDKDLLMRAMKKAYDFTIDYSDVSPLVKKIRSGLTGAVAGVTPYITFNLHAPYVFAESFRRNPFRAVSMLLLPVFMTLGAWTIVKDSSEEGRQLWEMAIDSFKNFKTIVLPYKDEQGKYTFISLAGWHPLDNYYDLIANLHRGAFGRALIESGVLYSNPISQALVTILTGKEPFTDKEYFTDLDKAIPIRYIVKVLKLLGDIYMPSIVKSYGAIPSYLSGMDRDRALVKILGIHIHKRSLEEFIKYREAEYLRALIDLGKKKGEYERKLYRGDISYEEYNKLMEEYYQLEERIRRKRFEMYKKLWGEGNEELSQ